MSKIALRALLDAAEGGHGSESFETKAIKVSITSKPLIPGLVSKGGPPTSEAAKRPVRGTSQRFAVRENSKKIKKREGKYVLIRNVRDNS